VLYEHLDIIYFDYDFGNLIDFLVLNTFVYISYHAVLFVKMFFKVQKFKRAIYNRDAWSEITGRYLLFSYPADV